MSPSRRKIQRVALYARISLTTEESVSIERQIEAGHKYAEARGWTVVLVTKDDGVSATKNKPEEREGWREILDSPEPFDAVVVWKVDRLARRVLDFLNADAALQERGAGLVAVEDPIDMTTPQGRAFATMLAVFGEMEAAAISARTVAAQKHLVKEGRLRGGDLPWFLQKEPNPNGAGFVARPVPERADAIRTAVDDLLQGASISEIRRRWVDAGFATPGRGKKAGDGRGSWSISTIKHLLTNKALYGATVHNGEILRNPDRTPKIDPERVIVDRETFERLQTLLNGRKRGPRPKNLPLLHGLAVCGGCDRPMRSHRRSGREDYTCANRDCPAPVSAQIAMLDGYVEDYFRTNFGALPLTRLVFEETGPSDDAVATLQADLVDVVDALEDDDLDDDSVASLRARRKALRAEIDQILARPSLTVRKEIETGERLGDAYDAAEDLDTKRDLLAPILGSVKLNKATVRGKHAAAHFEKRVEIAGPDPSLPDPAWFD